jgi:hypothetical protein
MPAHFRCPFILEAPHPRAGKPCGRCYMAPHEACVVHRPPPPERVQERTDEVRAGERRVRAARKARNRMAGIPAGWEV